RSYGDWSSDVCSSDLAWHQRRPPRRSVTLERRRAGKPLAVQAQAERSARRLHGRWHALESRGKPRTIIVVAVARELAGHCWAIRSEERRVGQQRSARS